MSFVNRKKSKTVKDPGLGIDLQNRILELVQEGHISCADAFRLSAELKVSLESIGQFADFRDIRLVECQLGLFGIGPGKKKTVIKGGEISEQLKQAIESALIDGKLTCRSAWEIAFSRNIAKIDVSNACESMGIRIRQCRLGAF